MLGKYQTWRDDNTSITTNIHTPSEYVIHMQSRRTITLNIGTNTITKIKLIGYLCENITTTINRPVNGWREGNIPQESYATGEVTVYS